MTADTRWRRLRRRLARSLPGTLRGRFVLIMVVGVLAAQLASYVIWTSQVRDSRLAQLEELSSNVAFSVASTMRFFRSLPREYRHIVLDQLRDMGGPRFFVSVNEKRLDVADIGEGPEKARVVETFRRILTEQLDIDAVSVEFSRPETLRVFNNEVLLKDLPPRWGQHSLLMEPLSPPILVVQLELEPATWLYLATILPIAEVFEKRAWLSGERLLAGLFYLLPLVVMLITSVKPLANRIAVMRDGHILQLGTPDEVYNDPVDIFVAGFMGSPSMNFITTTLEGQAGDYRLRIATAGEKDLILPWPTSRETPALPERVGQPVILGLRPEHFSEEDRRLSEQAEGTLLEARVSVVEPTGADILLNMPLGESEVTARVGPKCRVAAGERLSLRVDMGRAVLFDSESQRRLA
ncbi:MULTISPECIES: TOBE domain-containing protein [Halomonas]|uniref:TOBE domain-containing protein n=1 Tax=Halomonas ventosae TaxID=229007 RepID=A0A4R6HEI4_9GAMM|nr:TOBE domain-containing protein [Halomonas ventosae]TDO06892.1 TOBE domain-containing protein [Halomonas ventosae]